MYDVYKIPRASEKDVFPPKIGEMELKIDNVFDPRTKFLQAREQKKKQRNDVRGKASLSYNKQYLLKMRKT